MRVGTATGIIAAAAGLALATAASITPAHPHEVPDLQRATGWPLVIKRGETVVYPGRPMRLQPAPRWKSEALIKFARLGSPGGAGG
ncbi:MAG: hypothetical protein HY053_02935 [Proteobacteria bacterium]|nr:hypothetical protein [Pseudomonadota bacterium]